MASIKITAWGGRVMGTCSLSLYGTANWSPLPKTKRQKGGGGVRLVTKKTFV